MTGPAAQPRTVMVAGRRIEAVEHVGASDRPPLVLLHEGLGSVSRWRDFPADLAAATGRRVLAFSRFGHGWSDPPPRPRTPAFFREEALEVLPALLTELGAQNPVLVGHSDGGSIALIHAGAHRVGGLVLLAPHVIVEEITVEAIRQTRETFLEGDLRERMFKHHRDPDAAFWGWCDVWLDPAFRGWNLEADARRVTASTLLIQGADDPFGTLVHVKRLEASLRGPVERVLLPGGHSPQREHREAVVSVVARFLASLPSSELLDAQRAGQHVAPAAANPAQPGAGVAVAAPRRHVHR